METETAIDRFLASPDARRVDPARVRAPTCATSPTGSSARGRDARGRRRPRARRLRGRARPRRAAGSRRRRSPAKLAAVRSFLRFTLGPARVPDASLAPRRPRRLPEAPKRDEIERSLDSLDGDGPLALRNRALVELVYSAGLRSAEAVGLDLGDVDFEQELVHVRGKGGKERVVPLGEEAAHGSRATCAKRGRSSRAAPRTRSSSRRAAGGSTRARCGGCCPTRTGCATRSRRTCSRAAPTCARSRSCSATPRSRRRRSTATSTRKRLPQGLRLRPTLARS